MSAARVAFVVSPHGFGHAARSAAVVEALRRLRPELEVHVFSTVPSWFWADSLDEPYELHEVLTDVGLVQLSPIEEDPAATLERLSEIRPLETRARALASELARVGADLAVCDISPLGLVAARLAGVPSALVESFTWDWIYEAYVDAEPGLAAADVVVGKLGYSTVAEAWACGCRYLYVPRPRFPESPFLAAFVREQLPSAEVPPETFAACEWVDELESLLARPRPPERTLNGAAAAADHLSRRL